MKRFMTRSMLLLMLLTPGAYVAQGCAGLVIPGLGGFFFGGPTDEDDWEDFWEDFWDD